MSSYYIDPMVDYILGIVMAIIASAMFTFGAIFQKKGADELKENGVEIKMNDIKTLITMAKNKIWLVGIILGSLGGLPYFASQALIGVTLAQPLQGTGLLMLVISAVYYLKEKLKLGELIGVSILIFGPIFLSLSNVQDIDIALEITDIGFISSILIFYVLCISGIIISYVLSKKDFKPSIMLALNSGIFFGMGAISAQLGVFFLEMNAGILSILGAILGFGMIIIGNAIGTLIVNMAFQKGKAVRIIPIQGIGNLLIPIIGGIVIFQQVVLFLNFFIIGVCCQLIGGILIVRLQAKMQETSEIEAE
ncbi:MAG: DMT family transporter [Candidatus Helarchaeota archaeon]